MEASLESSSVETTHAIGREIGSRLGPGDVVLLSGGLGAGKTTLTQGILWGLGSEEYARSPTFVLINEYQARLPLYHMDLYRLDSFAELDSLGFDDYMFGEGVCVIEWADKSRGYFPADHIALSIRVTSETGRLMTISADAERHHSLLDSVARLSAAANRDG